MTDVFMCPNCSKHPATKRVDGNLLRKKCANEFIASRSRALDYSNQHR